MILRTLALAMAALLLWGAAAGAEEEKWAVVDISRLMKESDPGKAGIKYIEDQQTLMQKDLDDIQSKLENAPKDQELMRSLQQTYAASQQKIQAAGASIANMLFDAVKSALDKYRADNGYAMLIGVEAVASYDPAKDVTEAVMAEVNKAKLDFAKAAQAAEKEAGEEAAQAGAEARKDDDKKAAKEDKK